MAEMSEAEQKIMVHVRYGGMEKTFTGSVNEVWVSVNKFFSEVIPAFHIARKISLTVDLAKLVEDFKDVVAIAPEGPEVLIPKERLTDSETLQLYLLAAYMGYRLGKLPRETMTKEELAAKLGKSTKITTTRLGELVKEGLVVRVEEDYGMTTIGVRRLQDKMLSRKKE